MKMQFSLGHMARAMTRETLRKELPDSRLLEVKIFLRNQSNCAIAFVQARTVCMQDSLPSGFRDQCLAQGNNFPSCHFLVIKVHPRVCWRSFLESFSKVGLVLAANLRLWSLWISSDWADCLVEFNTAEQICLLSSPPFEGVVRSVICWPHCPYFPWI